MEPVIFHDSFSGLLTLIKQGRFSGDSPNRLYYFSCSGTLGGLTSAVQSSRFPENKVVEVLEMLVEAERDNRVSWRTDPSSEDYEDCERTRFCRMLHRAREMGAVIPFWNPFSEHYDAYWNLPAMRRFLGNSVLYANRI
jgi:hypothetical protein